MSIYAVIKVGAVQQRVSVGDTVEVPHNFPEEAIEPIFMGSSTGSIKADKESLKDSLVEFETMGNTKSKKINIFQYKNKTGNRRRMGYREDKKIIKITSITNSEFEEEE
jgi:large subunit ribosomal protein L21|tara:strand:- start:1270 stop:1596 length:327 start_codon:yes stop_codon:yes gene_type:complete